MNAAEALKAIAGILAQVDTTTDSGPLILPAGTSAAAYIDTATGKFSHTFRAAGQMAALAGADVNYWNNSWTPLVAAGFGPDIDTYVVVPTATGDQMIRTYDLGWIPAPPGEKADPAWSHLYGQ